MINMLPNDLIMKIYEYESTYIYLYKKCIIEMVSFGKIYESYRSNGYNVKIKILKKSELMSHWINKNIGNNYV